MNKTYRVVRATEHVDGTFSVATWDEAGPLVTKQACFYLNGKCLAMAYTLPNGAYVTTHVTEVHPQVNR
jgi:hypothetical protein